ncbi:ABC transporter ATP-binding protein [Luteimonas sp. R10]|uniref:ABC transporter ATP-binding protein n=1 Tax=Luteimonas sp. R10 TaxID=3108176 RepID=UPI003092A442|nr:ABC transporter ATP-binding protein [Luteimonas sp. R10]
MTAYIRARNIGLEVPYYIQPEKQGRSWLGTLFGAATAVPKRRFATLLDEVAFDVEEGDRVALIGRNGAGKTTLLRILTGAFQPTRGELQVSGTRQALLNLSLGFNPEGTLHENIYLRATAMGISASKVRDMVGSILEFAELEQVANRRLHTLSSGQRMRLGFAISTSIQHDIMLLDEWFGAGDVQFVKKARERLSSRINGSKIVVVASHNQTLTKRLCNKGLVLEQGRILHYGPLEEAMREYSAFTARPASRQPNAVTPERKKVRAGAGA